MEVLLVATREETLRKREETLREKPRGRSSAGSKSKLRFDPSKNSHNLMTHFPMDSTCPICNSCKRNLSHCRSKKHGEPDQLPEPKNFADALTADHKIG